MTQTTTSPALDQLRRLTTSPSWRDLGESLARPDRNPTLTTRTGDWFWSSVEEHLLRLASTPADRSWTLDWIEATRRQAPRMPPDLLLSEVIGMASAMGDPTFWTCSREDGMP